MEPMLATSSQGHPPSGDQWRHEVKWDGMRVLADVRAGEVTLSARSGRDATVRFPEFAALGRLYDDLLLDGEVVALVHGKPSFSALAERMHVADRGLAARLAEQAPLTFVAFDVLRVLGQSIAEQPWSARRAMLERLDLGSGAGAGLVLVPPVHTDGESLLAATGEQQLEGIVSKRITAPYQPGRRSPDWVKTPHRPTVSALIGGWRTERESSNKLGALLVGVPSVDPRISPEAPLHYLGRVGSGLAGRLGAQVQQALLATEDPSDEGARMPFTASGDYPIPAADLRDTTWVWPGLVVDIDAAGGFPGPGRRLRQPSVQRVRADLDPSGVWEAWADARALRAKTEGEP